MDFGTGFPIDLILFGMIAAFLVLRLRSILGRRTGMEGQPVAPPPPAEPGRPGHRGPRGTPRRPGPRGAGGGEPARPDARPGCARSTAPSTRPASWTARRMRFA